MYTSCRVRQFAQKQAHTTAQSHPVHAKSAGTAPSQSLCSGHITAAKICSETALLSSIGGKWCSGQVFEHRCQSGRCPMKNLKYPAMFLTSNTEWYTTQQHTQLELTGAMST